MSVVFYGTSALPQSHLVVLDKKYIVAGTGFSRWLVSPAAIVIHLCIGKAYGFSAFWLSMSKALGIKKRRPSSAGPM